MKIRKDLLFSIILYVCVVFGFGIIGCECDFNNDDEPKKIHITFRLRAKVENSIGGGVNEVIVKFASEKWVYDDFEEEWGIRENSRFTASKITRNEAGPLVPAAGYTDYWEGFSYNISKNDMVRLTAQISNYPDTVKIIDYTYKNAKAENNGKSATATREVTLMHPDF